MAANKSNLATADEMAVSTALVTSATSLRFAEHATDAADSTSAHSTHGDATASPRPTDPIPAHPSFLLLTQNVSALMTAGGSVTTPTSAPSSSSACENTVTSHIDAFVSDLRSWLHRTAWQHAHRPTTSQEERERHGRVHRRSAHNADEATSHADEKSHPVCTTSSSSTCYSMQCTPALLDVVVIHLQGVPCHTRDAAQATSCTVSASDYLADALQHRLLPEAGWSSGLLRSPDPACPHTRCDVASLILLSPRMCAVSSMLSLPHRTFIPITDDPLSYGGSPTHVYHTRSLASSSASAMPQPGFLHLALRLGTTAVHLCNLHLPHDGDNVTALAQTPSVYATARAEAFLEAVAETLALAHKQRDAIFIAGDLNTRLDGVALVRRLRERHRIRLRPRRATLRCPPSFWRLFERKEEQERPKEKTKGRPDEGRAAQVFGDLDTEPAALLSALEAQSALSLAEMPVRFAPTFKRRTMHVRRCVCSAEERMSGRTAHGGTRVDSWSDGGVGEAVHTRVVCDAAARASHGARANSETRNNDTGEADAEDEEEGALSVAPERDDDVHAPEVDAATKPPPPTSEPTHHTRVNTVTPATVVAESFLMRERHAPPPLRHDRLPAWTDRVLFNPAALAFMMRGNNEEVVEQAEPETAGRPLCRTRQPRRAGRRAMRCEYRYTRQGHRANGRYAMRSSYYVDVNDDDEEEEEEENDDVWQQDEEEDDYYLDVPSSGDSDGGVYLTNTEERRASTDVRRMNRGGAAKRGESLRVREGTSAVPAAATWAALEAAYGERSVVYDAVSLVHMDHDGVYLTF